MANRDTSKKSLAIKSQQRKSNGNKFSFRGESNFILFCACKIIAMSTVLRRDEEMLQMSIFAAVYTANFA